MGPRGAELPGTFSVVMLQLGPDDKRMKLRYAGSCRLCGTALPGGADAVYERRLKTVRCIKCRVVVVPLKVV